MAIRREKKALYMDGKLKKFLKKFFSIKDNKFYRDNWVENQLNKLPHGSRILDSGCGEQIYKKYCQHLEYLAQDFGQYDGIGTGKGLQVKEFSYGHLNYTGNCWQIDENDESFDAILCTEVLEHIPYPHETIKEFSRLLKPEGKLILTAPFSSLPHMEPYHYYSGFSVGFYQHFCAEYGLEIEEIDRNGNAFAFVSQEALRIQSTIKNPIIKLCYKCYIHFTLIPIMKIMSKLLLPNAPDLIFGFHIVASKKG